MKRFFVTAGFVSLCAALTGLGSGCTPPLMVAAIRNDTARFRAELNRAGASPQDLTCTLCMAVMQGNPEIARLSLERGADPDVVACPCYQPVHNYSPLQEAVERGNIPVVQAILATCPEGSSAYTPVFGSNMTLAERARKLKFEELARILDQYPGRDRCLADRHARALAAQTAQKQAKAEALSAPEENAGSDAEARSDWRGAVRHYAAALRALGDGSFPEIDARIRLKLLKASARLDPAPEIGEDAQRFAVRAGAFLKNAASPADFRSAVHEYRQALQFAPWWADAYFNMALVQEKIGDPLSAKRSLEFYLAANPNGKDAAVVKNKIIELEVLAERQGARPTVPSEGEGSAEPQPAQAMKQKFQMMLSPSPLSPAGR